MPETTLKKELSILIKECGGTPPEPQNNSLEDYFNFLRVHIKYLVFDLEATRRENNFFREFLKQNS